MKTGHTLLELYRFVGFRPLGRLKGVWGDPHARVITLVRREKKRFVEVATRVGGISTTLELDKFEIWIAGTNVFTWKWKFVECIAPPVAK